MADWYTEFNATFWLTMGTMVIGFAGLALKYGFASKCDNVQLCCGLLTVHRAVQLESAEVETDDTTAPSSAPPEINRV